MRTLPGKDNEKRYSIIRSLGSGGFGEVYEATDNATGSKVAIKVFRLTPDTRQTDWDREATHLLKLKNENVIEGLGYLKSNDDNGNPISYLVMEYAEGGNLRELLKSRLIGTKKEFLPTDQLNNLMIQALNGLAFINRVLLHRDIKPENFLFANGEMKISDFGLAKYVDESTRSKTYKGWGTYQYMAPESWALGKVSKATDIYSLGIVFFELCTLQLPFVAADPKSLEDLHRFGLIPDIRSINPDLPPGISGIVRRAMQKDPGDRYQSAEEMLRDLEEVQEAGGVIDLGGIVDLANRLYTEEQQKKSEEAKRLEEANNLYKRNLYKVNEFFQEVQLVVDEINRSIPQEKLFLSKGTETDYTLIWRNKDLIRFSFNPHVGLSKLKIDGNNILATGHAEILSGQKGEGQNFILVGLSDENTYGEWKILEVRGNALAPGYPNYSVAAAMDIVERISKLGNAMDVWTHETKGITNLKEEILILIQKSMEYLDKSRAESYF